MCATAANLIERVLPESGLRQWVLTFPFSWRRRLAQDGALLGRLTRIFVETVHRFYAARAAQEGGAAPRPARSPWCRGPRPICGSTRTCTWSFSMAPSTSRAASSPGTGSATSRPARSERCSSARSGASRGTFAAAACLVDDDGADPDVRAARSRGQPRRLRRLGPGAARRAAVDARPSAARAARRSPTTSRCAPRSMASPCTRPRARARSTRRAARRCCATCCARPSRRSASSFAPTAWCASP